MSNIIKLFQVGGKTFSSMADAKRAEFELETIARLRNVLKEAINSVNTRTGNIDNVLIEMLSEEAAIREILLSYSKRKPRKKLAS